MTEQLLARMRNNLRLAVPILRTEEWEEADIRAISPAIKRAIDGNDAEMVRCWADWLESKVWGNRGGVAVRPALPLHMELKHLDREWKRGNER